MTRTVDIYDITHHVKSNTSAKISEKSQGMIKELFKLFLKINGHIYV